MPGLYMDSRDPTLDLACAANTLTNDYIHIFKSSDGNNVLIVIL